MPSRLFEQVAIARRLASCVEEQASIPVFAAAVNPNTQLKVWVAKLFQLSTWNVESQESILVKKA